MPKFLLKDHFETIFLRDFSMLPSSRVIGIDLKHNPLPREKETARFPKVIKNTSLGVLKSLYI